MAINGLGYHYYQNSRPVSGKNIGDSHKADFRATVTEVSFSGGHRVTIDPDALFSICDAATGKAQMYIGRKGILMKIRCIW